MQVIPLDTMTCAMLGGYTHQVIVTHADFTETATATAQTLPLLSVKVGDVVDRACMILKVPFEDTTDSAFNDNKITVGDGGDVDRFLATNTAGTGLQVNVNGTEVLNHINPVAASTAGLATAPFSYTADDTVDLVMGSMTAKSLVNLNKGELHIFLKVAQFSKLPVR